MLSNRNCNHKLPAKLTSQSRSVETIYKNAVQKRISSSSEEDMIDPDFNAIEFFADDFEPDYEDEPMEHEAGDAVISQLEHGMADQDDPNVQQELTPPALERVLSAEEKAERLVIEAERAKANIFPVAGMCISNCNHADKIIETNLNLLHFTAKIDEDYLVVGAHIDDTMWSKIIKGEYVDFGRLLLRDRILAEEDGRMELVIKNGHTFGCPFLKQFQLMDFLDGSRHLEFILISTLITTPTGPWGLFNITT